MAHQRPDTRIITGKATAKGKKARKSLCVEIGSLEHPYFSNSVRRQIREAGIESFSPKLPALYLEKKFERRETLRLNQTFNTDGGDSLDGGLHSRILTSSEIRKSMHHGHASKPTTSATSIQTPPLIHLEKKKDGDDLTNKGGGDKISPKTNMADLKEDDEEEAIDWRERARTYNPIFVKQKRKVASAILTMAKNIKVRNAVVRDGGVRALHALVRMYDNVIDADCSDALCFLADAVETRSSMFSDGAMKAILHLAGRTTSNADRYSLGLALGSLACETGYESDLIDSGALYSLLEMQKSANEYEMDEAVGRAL